MSSAMSNVEKFLEEQIGIVSAFIEQTSKVREERTRELEVINEDLTQAKNDLKRLQRASGIVRGDDEVNKVATMPTGMIVNENSEGKLRPSGPSGPSVSFGPSEPLNVVSERRYQ